MATLARNWWLLVLRGIAAILFGVFALLWPGATLASLVVLFGLYSLVEGGTSLVLAFMKAEGRTGTWILHALVGIGAGILTFAYPGITAITLYAIIAGWAIAKGIVEILVASDLRHAGGDVGTIVFAGDLIDPLRDTPHRPSGGRCDGAGRHHRGLRLPRRYRLGDVRRATAQRRRCSLARTGPRKAPSRRLFPPDTIIRLPLPHLFRIGRRPR